MSKKIDFKLQKREVITIIKRIHLKMCQFKSRSLNLKSMKIMENNYLEAWTLYKRVH